jgi:hypothetical protein
MSWLELLIASAAVLAADQLSKRRVLAEPRFAAVLARRPFVSIHCVINRRPAIISLSDTGIVAAWVLCAALALFALEQELVAASPLAMVGIGLVLGDAVQPPADPLVLRTGMQVDGAFVTVPYSPDINPAAFTVEAWVRPEWDPAVPAYRAIVDSRDNVGGTVHGFVLWVNEAGNWEGAVADVNGNFIFVTAGAAVMKKTTYLAFTFDGATGIATLFTDNMKTTQQMPLGATYSPNTTQPLVIGVGERYLTDRMNSTGDNFFPIFPFNGVIQDVAIYDSVLPDTTINTHQVDGSGNGPPEPPAPAG